LDAHFIEGQAVVVQQDPAAVSSSCVVRFVGQEELETFSKDIKLKVQEFKMAKKLKTYSGDAVP